MYGGKVWYSNTKYRWTIYWCNRKYEKGKDICATPHFSEEDIKRAFVTVYNKMIQDKGPILTACHEVLDKVLDPAVLERQIDDLRKKADELSMLIRSHISVNASRAQDQASYAAKHEDLTSRLESVNRLLAERQADFERKQARRYEIGAYLDTLEQSGDLLTKFDPLVWNFSVDTLTIQQDGAMVFRFKDGRAFESDVNFPDEKSLPGEDFFGGL